MVFTTLGYKPVHSKRLTMTYSIKKEEWEIDFLHRIYESFQVRSTNPAVLHLKSVGSFLHAKIELLIQYDQP